VAPAASPECRHVPYRMPDRFPFEGRWPGSSFCSVEIVHEVLVVGRDGLWRSGTKYIFTPFCVDSERRSLETVSS